MSVTVILNVYKRQQHLKEQFDAIINQTKKPEKIFIWNNGATYDFSPYKKHPLVTFFDVNKNMGVWPRFIIGLTSTTDYICVFDDDTIPGKKWLENCLNTIKTYDGILGTIGLILNPGDQYTFRRVGWAEPNETTVEADIVGHSWFFKKKYLEEYVRELPNIQQLYNVGEDMHFTYVLQKYKYLKAYVPPHPKNNLELWGSNPQKAYKYGTEAVSIYETFGREPFHKQTKNYIGKGYVSINNKNINLRDYNKCFDFVINCIKIGKPFCLMRYSDREYNIINNKQTSFDKWTFKSGSILATHLKQSLDLLHSNVFYGIPSSCDNASINKYYKDNIKNYNNITYANIWVNNNYGKTKTLIETHGFNIILIGSKKPDKLGKLNIVDFYQIPEDLVNRWDGDYKQHIDKLQNLSNNYQKTIFFISAGPLAAVFIHKMYNKNQNNFYIDIGSAIDPFIKGINRPYQKAGNQYSVHVCNNI